THTSKLTPFALLASPNEIDATDFQIPKIRCGLVARGAQCRTYSEFFSGASEPPSGRRSGPPTPAGLIVHPSRQASRTPCLGAFPECPRGEFALPRWDRSRARLLPDCPCGGRRYKYRRIWL